MQMSYKAMDACALLSRVLFACIVEQGHAALAVPRGEAWAADRG